MHVMRPCSAHRLHWSDWVHVYPMLLSRRHWPNIEPALRIYVCWMIYNIPANKMCWPNVVLMLGKPRRGWPALAQHWVNVSVGISVSEAIPYNKRMVADWRRVNIMEPLCIICYITLAIFCGSILAVFSISLRMKDLYVYIVKYQPANKEVLPFTRLYWPNTQYTEMAHASLCNTNHGLSIKKNS